MKIEEICAIHICGWSEKAIVNIKDYLLKPLLTTDTRIMSFYREMVGVLINFIDRWLYTRYSAEQRLMMINSILSLIIKHIKSVNIKDEAEFKEYILKKNSEWWLRDMIGISDGGLFADVADHIYLLSAGPKKDFTALHLYKVYFWKLYREIINGITKMETMSLACEPEDDRLMAESIISQIEKCELAIIPAPDIEGIKNAYSKLKQMINNKAQVKGPVRQIAYKNNSKSHSQDNLMSRTDFWKLIELIDKPALESGDEEAAGALLFQALEKLSEEELRSFDSNLQEVISDIDGDEYVKNAGISGESDDGFRYLRQFVVAQGQTFYENVKNNPKSIPNLEDCWFEYLDLIAPEVWAKKTGRELEEWYQE
jgi:hypothetical protein